MPEGDSTSESTSSHTPTPSSAIPLTPTALPAPAAAPHPASTAASTFPLTERQTEPLSHHAATTANTSTFPHASEQRSASSIFASDSLSVPPVAPKKFGTRVRSIHGDYFDDGWDWLRDRDNPDVIAHLEAENRWADQVCAPSSPVAHTLVNEVRSFTRLADASVPVRVGNYWYFHRWDADRSYRTHHRCPAIPGSLTFTDRPPLPVPGELLDGEELLVDENVQAAGHEFFRLADLIPSPDGRLIAWARDVTGDERYDWVIQEVSTGLILDQSVSNAGYSFAWSADSRSFIYIGVDEAWRAYQVWHHVLGTPQSEDRLLFVEQDEHYEIGITESLDPQLVVIHSASTTCTHAWLWLPDEPYLPPLSLTGRSADVMVSVEPAGDHVLIVHTANSSEGSVAAAPLPNHEDLVHAADAQYRSLAGQPVVVGCGDEDHQRFPALFPPHTWVSLREPGEGERILDVEAAEHYFAVTMRADSFTQVEVHPRVREYSGVHLSVSDLRGVWGDGFMVRTPWEVRTLTTVSGCRFEDAVVRVEVQSQIMPPSTIQVDPVGGATVVVKTFDAPGWDPGDFVERRVWVEARDGSTRIPVTLVHHRDVTNDGSNAGWELGYGSYEVSYDPEFETLRLPLLRRGVVFAIAHIRGGGEMGRAWYEDGKALVKEHTFTDFIDVGHWLVDSGWVAPDRLIAEGRSAGGLLMGAVVNMAPRLYRAVIAEVPFVDALTTILDASLPLTVGEWEEWGNPVENAEVFRVMRGYTPYENVPEGTLLPAIMATTSVNDTRVEFVEPAKWVLRLREALGVYLEGFREASATAGGSQHIRASEEAAVNAADAVCVSGVRHVGGVVARPVVLRTQMVAGHAGPSGREGRWRARAEEFAFVLREVGICE